LLGIVGVVKRFPTVEQGRLSDLYFFEKKFMISFPQSRFVIDLPLGQTLYWDRVGSFGGCHNLSAKLAADDELNL